MGPDYSVLCKDTYYINTSGVYYTPPASRQRILIGYADHLIHSNVSVPSDITIFM
jgi:hypothetical protein